MTGGGWAGGWGISVPGSYMEWREVEEGEEEKGRWTGPLLLCPVLEEYNSSLAHLCFKLFAYKSLMKAIRYLTPLNPLSIRTP